MQLKFTQEEMTQIGHRIQNARVASKLTQAQLAERCECSEKHLGDIERGVASVSLPLVVRIGKALNTGVDYYLAESSDYYADILIDVELSEALRGCDKETRMLIRDTAKRIAEYDKRIRGLSK